MITFYQHNGEKNAIYDVQLTERRSRPAGSRFGTTVFKSCKAQNKIKFNFLSDDKIGQ